MNLRAPLLFPLLFPLLLSGPGCVVIGDGESESGSGSDSDSGSGSGSDSDSDSDSEPLLPLDGPCGASTPTERLAVITTDFASGGVSIADATMSVDVDVANATTDTLATGHLGDLYLIHRYGFNSIDVLSADTWSTRGSYDVVVDGVPEPNPQSLVFPGDGASQTIGYLTLFGAAQLQIIDFDGDAPEQIGSVDLSVFADDDGNPEAGVAIACGSTVLVGIQRLDPTFTPVDSSYIVAIDSVSQSPIDLDPMTDGMQGLALEGAWPRQIRVDPADPSGETILVLTSGIERVHVPSATRSWAVTAESLEAAGILGFANQAFVTDEAGEVAYITAADGDYPAAAVYRVGIDGAAPTTPEKLISGIATRERSLERMGQELWVGDASQDASGLRVWDLSMDPPVEMTAAPLDTGLPPYTVVAL